MPWMPLFKYPYEPIEQTCGGCKLKETKPGTQPRELMDAMMTAIDLDNLKECGAVFTYPDGLTSYQWTCLKALSAGRAIFQEKDTVRRMREAERNAQQSQLEARVRR
jgi:hypothetical protein